MTDRFIIEEAIRLVSEGVSVTFPVKGWSMLPFIIGGEESVILERPERQLKVGDIVLARVDDGRYVVHRITRLEGDDVTLMGDGNTAGTEHCLAGDVAAIATHAVDGRGRKRYLYTPLRQRAARLWRWLRPMRRYILAIYKRI